jgi:hypothetical protein
MNPANRFPLELPELVSEPSLKFPFGETAIGVCVDGRDAVQRRILVPKGLQDPWSEAGKTKKI